MQKSKKLHLEESIHSDAVPSIVTNARPAGITDAVIKIRPIHCCNDHCAIMRFEYKTDISVPEGALQRNEGIVVGVGPGVPGPNGARTPSQLQLGDVVMFRDRDVITKIESASPPYEHKQVVIMSERSLLCKLQPVEFEVIA